MASAKEAFADLSEEQLREVLFTVSCAHPEARQLVSSFLDPSSQSSDRSGPRSVSMSRPNQPASTISAPSLKDGDGVKGRINGHIFNVHNYMKPTFCKHCSKLLVGIVRQGQQCSRCQVNTHRKCAPYLPACEPKSTKRSQRRKSHREIRDKAIAALAAGTAEDPEGALRVAEKELHPPPGIDVSRDSILLRGSDDEEGSTGQVKESSTENEGEAAQRKTTGFAGAPRIDEEGEVGEGPEDQDEEGSYSEEEEDSDEGGGGWFEANSSSGESGGEEGSEGSEDEEEGEEGNGSDGRNPRQNFPTITEDSEEAESLSSKKASFAPSIAPSVAPSILSAPDSPRSSNRGTKRVQILVEEDESGSKATAGKKSDAGGHIPAPEGDGFHRHRRRSSRHRRHKTHAAEDWKSHGASFRRRISSSKKMDPLKLKAALENEEHILHEFDQIPHNLANIHTLPRLTDHKNRYFNILPNNHSRVVLCQLEDDVSTTYINANWMSGYADAQDKYVATQGPLSATCGDFWRMMWQIHSHVIVMNTNLMEADKEKCVRYWPSAVGESITFDNVKVTLVSEDASSAQQFVQSVLSIEHVSPDPSDTKEDSKPREVHHLWWRAWPDKGVPEDSSGIFPFVIKARTLQAKLSGPVVVHCSAGVGRTGCFMAIDQCMQQWDDHKSMDILGTVCKMRKERGMSVQTPIQYLWLHKVLFEYMQYGSKGVPSRRLAAGAAGASLQASASAVSTAASDIAPSASLLTVSPAGSTQSLSAAEISTSIKPARSNTSLNTVGQGSSVAKTPVTGSAAILRVAMLKAEANLFESSTSRKGSFSGSVASPGDRKASSLFASPAQQSVLSDEDIGHRFQTKTYVAPTNCSVCGELLEGLAQQGLRCRPCGTDVHHYCLEKVAGSCNRAKGGGVSRKASGLPQWPPPPDMHRSSRRRSKKPSDSA